MSPKQYLSANPPLPIRDGVAPSYLWLQKGEWSSLLEFLIQRFPDVSSEIWQSRMARGEVVNETGAPYSATSPYRWGGRIFYYREIEAETPIPFEEQILFQDQHILVVDKPHFLPVIPTGRFLHETLLVRLKNKYHFHDLTPIHRLDRETAGVMIFSINLASRGAYQALFQQRTVQKEYEALAPNLIGHELPLTYRSRMAPGTPFFRMQEVPGIANSETRIELIEQISGQVSRYRLHPLSGRKHQLRVHLAALGIPILNDAFYPIALPCKADDMSQPLQLLARSIGFNDPITGQERYFESQRKLVF
ncbi:pseudouridine synthase [Solimicrobium silvestre]|uniref:RNA pseudouridylate synthase n=1 Tax=Solimicrobium silvestre TaxID=2099400 RepID=A0A2S9GWX3_9BURK|nr:pseudouridine synthase [Solimicrobium silvestre]PRC92201.1 RNA pseudouridylate synthase [Solimicrobium silvestre]